MCVKGISPLDWAGTSLAPCQAKHTLLYYQSLNPKHCKFDRGYCTESAVVTTPKAVKETKQTTAKRDRTANIKRLMLLFTHLTQTTIYPTFFSCQHNLTQELMSHV